MLAHHQPYVDTAEEEGNKETAQHMKIVSPERGWHESSAGTPNTSAELKLENGESEQ